MKVTINDFSELNDLPAELKILIVNAQTLVDKAREKIKDRDLYMDMTSKMLLKTDCKEVEKYIKLISKGKTDEKTKAALELAVTKLNTNLDGIIRFYTR